MSGPVSRNARKKKGKPRMVKCRPSGRVMSRANYRLIYKAVRARREAYWAGVCSESSWISLPQVEHPLCSRQEPGLAEARVEVAS